MDTTQTQSLSAEAAAAIQAGVDDTFAINSLERLAWFGNKRAGLLAEIARIQANAKAITDALQKDLQGLDDRFMVQAESFAAQTLTATGWKTKTLKTLGGAFAFRDVPGGTRVKDAPALLAWAETNAPDLIKTVTPEPVRSIPAEAVKLFVAELQAQAAEDEAGGALPVQLPPGVEIVPTKTTFSHKAEV